MRMRASSFFVRPLLWSLSVLVTQVPLAAQELAAPPADVPVETAAPQPVEDASLAPKEVDAPNLDAPKLEPGRLRVRAGRVSKQGDSVTIEGEAGQPVVIESGDLEAGGARISAQSVQIDLQPGAPTLHAVGQVRIERSRSVQRSQYNFNRKERLDATGLPIEYGVRGRGAGAIRRPAPAGSRREEFFTEVFEGRDLKFDGRTRNGVLDGAQVQLSSLDISADALVVNGDNYQANGVVLRPGGLNPREREIYGTPPFSLRARQANIILQRGAAGDVQRARVIVRRAGLYFRNTRILPVPLGVLSPFAYVGLGPARGATSYSIVPRVSLSSADRFLFSTRISVPLGGFGSSRGTQQNRTQQNGTSANASTASTKKGIGAISTLNLNLGISARLGFRGGVSLESRSPRGVLALRALRADIVTTQLTNRLQLDRKPELSFDSPLVPIVNLGGGRGLSAFVSASAGSFAERTIGALRPDVESSRLTGTLGLSTRVDARDGLYADIFTTRSKYGLNNLSYTNNGFEIGYQGRVLPQVRGLFSYRHIALGGATPFRFDTIEIPSELRATFDIEATPRYLIPIDLRYDVDRSSLRDTSIGLLRNYKTFAYGAVYQTARRDLRFEVRTNF